MTQLPPSANPQTTQAEPARKLTWWSALIPLLIVAAAAGGYLIASNGDRGDVTATSPAGPTLEQGKDYYVSVRLIELYPTQPNGKPWDRLDGSGPDIDFQLQWQGNVVYDATQARDTLVGVWDTLSLDLKQAVLTQQLDLDGSIDAAIIHVDGKTEVTLVVWDSDVTGKDQAGEVVMRLDEMTLGDNTATFDRTETSAIKRIVVRVIDKSLPMEELVNKAMQP